MLCYLFDRWFVNPNFDIVHSTWPYMQSLRGETDQGKSRNSFDPRSRAREFSNLPGNPLITAIVQEVDKKQGEVRYIHYIILNMYY